jgi:superfamily II RNA helicase
LSRGASLCRSSQMRIGAILLLVRMNKRPYSLSNHSIWNKVFTLYHNPQHPSIFSVCRMEAVFAWCKGVKFVQVQELTGSFEGTTIRTLRRLEELVRQITVAAKAIGNIELEAKFEKASDLIKRDIVFCASLYL